MKKLLTIILTLLSIGLYAQSYSVADYQIARASLRVGDSVVTIIYSDTLINPAQVRLIVNNSITNKADTIYVLGQNEWVGMNDTISKVDTANYANNLIQDSTWVELTADTLITTVIYFDTLTDGLTNVKGGLHWDTTYSTLGIMNGDGSVTQIGQEINIYVKNQSGVSISDGDPVHLIASGSDEIRVGLASNLNAGTAYGTLGLATTDIPNGEYGRACFLGTVNNLNTTAFSEGDTLFMGDGVIQNTKPATGHIIVMGTVTRSNATLGTIWVNPRYLSNTIGFSILNKAGTSGTYIDSNKVTTDTSIVNTYLDVNGNSDLNGVLFTGSTKTAGGVYTGTTNPSNTNRLNYDGLFYSTGFRLANVTSSYGLDIQNSSSNIGLNVNNIGSGYGVSITNNSSNYGALISNSSGATSSAVRIVDNTTGYNALEVSNSATSTESGIYVTGISTTGNNIRVQHARGNGILIDNFGILGYETSGTFLKMQRYQDGATNATADFINIDDTPLTSGAASGNILTADIDGVERLRLKPRSSTTDTAYIFDTDSTLTSGALLSVRNQGAEVFRVDSSGVSIGGGDLMTTSDSVGLKPAVEAEQFDSTRIDTLVTDYIKFPDGTRMSSSSYDLPMGEISYFNLTGTVITISLATTDGTDNMVVVNPTTTEHTENYLFDNGGSNNGRLRYTGDSTMMFHIAATWSASPGTNNDIIIMAVAKNGTILPASRNPYSMGTTAQIRGNAIHVMTNMNTNDYLELYVGNNTGTSDVTIKQINLVAMGAKAVQ